MPNNLADAPGCQSLPELLVSAAVGPLLLGILGSRGLAELMQQIGQASEEIFRGDRLPVLKLPNSSADQDPTSNPSN
ncbi:MAG: hypothetical protein F6K19_04570 [Cyanothece sp. SIO1E1]|nr:hypothetical protein [Cyanothece sp. SIO1E1]